MPLDRVDGVLLDLNETETDLMREIFRLAETAMETGRVNRMRWPSGRYFGEEETKRLLTGFIGDLRDVLGLAEDAEVGGTELEDAERARREAALKRRDRHVAPSRVLCAYDCCTNTFVIPEGALGNAWDGARDAGWRDVWADGTDLYCPSEECAHTTGACGHSGL